MATFDLTQTAGAERERGDTSVKLSQSRTTRAHRVDDDVSLCTSVGRVGIKTALTFNDGGQLKRVVFHLDF